MKGILGGNDDPEMGLESPLLDEDFGDGEGKEYRSPLNPGFLFPFFNSVLSSICGKPIGPSVVLLFSFR